MAIFKQRPLNAEEAKFLVRRLHESLLPTIRTDWIAQASIRDDWRCIRHRYYPHNTPSRRSLPWRHSRVT